MTRQKIEMEKKREIDVYHRDGSTTKTLILSEGDNEDCRDWFSRCGYTEAGPRIPDDISHDIDEIEFYYYTGKDESLIGTYLGGLYQSGIALEVIAKDKFAVLEFLLKYKPLMEGQLIFLN